MTFNVERFRQIKDKSLNICVDHNLFPSLIDILYGFVTLSSINWNDLIVAKFITLDLETIFKYSDTSANEWPC